MVDTSASMECDDCNPLYSAIGLGIRIAEKSKFGKRVLTFSSEPNWINLEPFDFQIESEIQKLDLKKILPSKNMLDEIFSQEFLLNENFNGKLSIKSDNLSNGSFFNEILIRADILNFIDF